MVIKKLWVVAALYTLSIYCVDATDISSNSFLAEGYEGINDGADEYPEGYTVHEDVWFGPGYYYGVWFDDEPNYWQWRRNHWDYPPNRYYYHHDRPIYYTHDGRWRGGWYGWRGGWHRGWRR